MFTYKAIVTRVVDGDTFDAEVDLGFRTYRRERFRLLDVDTPERGQRGFDECTDRLRQLLIECQDPDGRIIIKSRKTGKFGRWLAAIMHPSMSEISSMLKLFMLENGYVEG